VLFDLIQCIRLYFDSFAGFILVGALLLID